MNSQREAFEKANPKPDGVFWSAMQSCYVSGKTLVVERYQGRWEGWQAATEQGVSVLNEHGKNRYGLDMAYFRNLFNRELNRPLVDFRPDELARVLARASRTADSSVLLEPEFQAEQGVGEPVAWQTEIHAYDPPARCTHGSLRSAKAYQEGAGIDRCRIVPLYTHPPKPTECYSKQDCQEEFKRGFNDGWDTGRFMLEVDQAAKPTGGGVPDRELIIQCLFDNLNNTKSKTADAILALLATEQPPEQD